MEHFREVTCVSRRREFVSHRLDMILLPRVFQDAIDETGTIRPEDPGCANDEMRTAGCEHEFLPFPLRLAVDTDWLRRIFFKIRLGFPAIKNVVRADVNEPSAFLSRNFCEHSRRFHI